ncbi:hypothetical protein Z042_06050 [Chania multitudinisentens RB-25]|uniref:YqcC-like domain-containing protein n=1 Tax=Chania multitudinisentens RB-25 TaxID=1441930 RepID=W0L5Z3_9GAMM|nr:YqcC family protein [Chania multitudinisentens]AHG19228.1 hypothetical protein Z042_06050 [Chania multitudinisentens RB-25]
MSIENQIRHSLQSIEQAMRDLALWQTEPPEAEAFASTEPFCVDRMLAEEWLQWVLLPRMHALLDTKAQLPTSFMIAPYFDVALKHKQPGCAPLLELLQRLDALLNKEPQ